MPHTTAGHGKSSAIKRFCQLILPRSQVFIFCVLTFDYQESMGNLTPSRRRTKVQGPETIGFPGVEFDVIFLDVANVIIPRPRTFPWPGPCRRRPP